MNDAVASLDHSYKAIVVDYPKGGIVVRILTRTGPHYEKFKPDDTEAIKAWAAKYEPAEFDVEKAVYDSKDYGTIVTRSGE